VEYEKQNRQSEISSVDAMVVVSDAPSVRSLILARHFANFFTVIVWGNLHQPLISSNQFTFGSIAANVKLHHAKS